MEVSIESTELDKDTTCPICNAEFLDIDDLNIHMSLHIQLNVSYKHFCIHCQKIFSDIEFYAQHIIENHLISALSCGYCSRVFYDTKLLKKHEIKHNATSLTTRISCSQCMSYFYNNTDLESHEFQEHKESKDGIMLQECFSMLSSLLNMNIRKFLNVLVENITYRCVYCNLSTPDVTMYINHLNDERVKSYACDNCYDVFPNKITLRKHYTHRRYKCNKYVSKNSPEKQCKKCQQKFLLTSYKRHIKVCSGMKCIPCNVNFESVDDYSSHLKFHKKAIPLSTCKFCFRQFVGTFSLEKHIERAHKESFHLYKYKCVDCDQLFMHPKLLFTHYFTKHKSLEPYTCKICDKKFKVRKKFTLHIKLQHKSLGFVEFDDNYLVFFTDKKSEKPFIPQCQVPIEEMAGKEIHKHKTAGKIKLKSNKRLESKADKEDSNTSNVDEAESQTFKSHLEHNTNKLTKKVNNKEKTKRLDVLEQENIGEEIDHVETNTVDETNLASAEENISHSGFDFMNATETEGDHTEAEPNLLIGRKRKLKVTKTRKRAKKVVDTDLSSDDSDVPLESFKNKVKCKQNLNSSRVRRLKEKFICQKCNKNCYTYQNYHHHLSLHARDKTKQCIKCDENFTSKSALTEHIKQAHSSSKLTETLKQLLERRKNNLPMPVDRKSIAEGLRRTIKKVIFEESNTSVTMTPVDDKISVKNFFETFTADTTDTGTKKTDDSITIKAVDGSDVSEPLIKMIKFTPDVVQFNPRPKMPVKFKDDPSSQKYIVSFKLSTVTSSRSILRFSNKIDTNCSYNDNQNEQYDETYTDPFDGESDVVEDKEDSIPDVAEEVLLNTEPEKQDTIAIQSIPEEYANLKIGHLQEKAPYYKIVNITEVIKPTLKQEKTEAPKKIVLPDGTKLVNVNPLAHLMGDTNMQEIFKPQKRYYEPKPRDITTAIAKALHHRKPTRKKKIPDLCD